MKPRLLRAVLANVFFPEAGHLYLSEHRLRVQVEDSHGMQAVHWLLQMRLARLIASFTMAYASELGNPAHDKASCRCRQDIYYCHAWALGALETPAAKLGGIDSH